MHRQEFDVAALQLVQVNAEARQAWKADPYRRLVVGAYYQHINGTSERPQGKDAHLGGYEHVEHLRRL
jgi:hypothetical protein